MNTNAHASVTPLHQLGGSKVAKAAWSATAKSIGYMIIVPVAIWLVLRIASGLFNTVKRYD